MHRELGELGRCRGEGPGVDGAWGGKWDVTVGGGEGGDGAVSAGPAVV